MSKVFSLPVARVDIEEINDGDFLKLTLYAISTGVNRNNSKFLEEGFEESIKTIYNKPILAYYNKLLNDTEEHNSKLDIDSYGETFYDYDFQDAEKPVGVIPESSKITVEEYQGKKWIKIDPGYVWVEYNHRLTKLIKEQISKKISVEIEPIISYYDEDGTEIIKTWKFLGVTILGKTRSGEFIEEGIEGAKLVLKDLANSEEFESYKKKFKYAFSSKQKYNSEILSRYGVDMTMKEFDLDKEYGTKPAISVDKSREAVSFDSWGDVDKAELRDRVLRAKNYRTLVKSVYLDVEEGWEEAPSEKLKYPVMQYKNGKLVYSAGGLLSAQQYGEKYDEAVAKKATSLRKKLGLEKAEKEERMKEFISAARTNGFTFVGMCDGKLAFVKDCEDENKEKMTEKKKLDVYEVDKKKAENYCEEIEFDWDELTGRSVGLTDRDNGDHNDWDDRQRRDDHPGRRDDDDDDDDDDDKDEMRKRLKDLERERNEMAHKCKAMEKELREIRMAKFKEDTDAILADEIADMDERTHEDLKRMRDEGKFESVEDFAKEVAYRKYMEGKKDREYSKKRASLSFSINTKQKEVSLNKQENLINELSKI